MTIPGETLFVLLVWTTLLFLLAGPSHAQVLTTMDTAKTDTLKASAIRLKTVDIKAFRNTRLDSLFNRKEFANVYKYNGSGFMDLFSQKASFSKDYQRFQNSTSSIIGINLLNSRDCWARKAILQISLSKLLLRKRKPST